MLDAMRFATISSSTACVVGIPTISAHVCGPGTGSIPRRLISYEFQILLYILLTDPQEFI